MQRFGCTALHSLMACLTQQIWTLRVMRKEVRPPLNYVSAAGCCARMPCKTRRETRCVMCNMTNYRLEGARAERDG